MVTVNTWGHGCERNKYDLWFYGRFSLVGNIGDQILMETCDYRIEAMSLREKELAVVSGTVCWLLCMPI